VRQAVAEAIETARAGGGPSLVEALTYRLSDHTTADDASRYRDDAEVSAHWKLEPDARLRRYMSEAGLWSKEDEERLIEACAAEVEAAVEAYLALPPLPPTAMFDHLYAELPAAFAEQRAALAAAADAPEVEP